MAFEDELRHAGLALDMPAILFATNCLNIKFYASKILLDLPTCLKSL